MRRVLGVLANIIGTPIDAWNANARVGGSSLREARSPSGSTQPWCVRTRFAQELFTWLSSSSLSSRPGLPNSLFHTESSSVGERQTFSPCRQRRAPSVRKVTSFLPVVKRSENARSGADSTWLASTTAAQGGVSRYIVGRYSPGCDPSMDLWSPAGIGMRRRSQLAYKSYG